MQGYKKEFMCSCGKKHVSSVDDIIVEKGAINRLPEFIKKYNAIKPFILADEKSFCAGGTKVIKALESNNINYSKYVFEKGDIEPDENAVGSAVMHFDKSCDIVIGVGSGVINDIGKILSATAKLPYIVVATAPSMDGYASATSSVSVDGLKVSLPSRCANVVIGDLEVLKNAPLKMMLSGLGDMIAKLISICEWRLSNLITGEYYCEKIATIIRSAVKKCIDNADGLLHRDEDAVKAVFNGLVMGGVAMDYAGCSRPASGCEHYFSHVWDMRGLEFGAPVDFHGIQCAIGTLYAIKIYEQVVRIKPDKEKALEFARAFDKEKYEKELREFLGKSADTMIALDRKENKYDVNKHAKRLEIIISNWDKILKIIEEELISYDELFRLMDKLGMPKTCEEIGISASTLKQTFFATKDIRDKYVLSRLCWDLGVIDKIIL